MKKHIYNAGDVLGKYNLLGKLPIDIEYICKRENIDVHFDDFSELEKEHGHEISGLIYLDKEEQERIIFVNKRDNYPRQRFTIAHELGHYFLHFDDEKDGAFISFRSSQSRRETEANKFASDLLMPAEMVRSEHRKTFIPTSSYLADIFEVSNTAMAIRLGCVDIMPALIFAADFPHLLREIFLAYPLVLGVVFAQNLRVCGEKFHSNLRKIRLANLRTFIMSTHPKRIGA